MKYLLAMNPSVLTPPQSSCVRHWATQREGLWRSVEGSSTKPSNKASRHGTAPKAQMFKPYEAAEENKEQLNYKGGKDTMFVYG